MARKYQSVYDVYLQRVEGKPLGYNQYSRYLRTWLKNPQQATFSLAQGKEKRLPARPKDPEYPESLVGIEEERAVDAFYAQRREIAKHSLTVKQDNLKLAQTLTFITKEQYTDITSRFQQMKTQLNLMQAAYDDRTKDARQRWNDYTKARSEYQWLLLQLDKDYKKLDLFSQGQYDDVWGFSG